MVRVRAVPVGADTDLDAALTPLRRALFGLSGIVAPNGVSPESDGLSLSYPLPADTPNLADHPPLDALPVAIELCQAVGELHDRGFSHGAIDPRLIFVTSNGVRILGAGLAELIRATSGAEAPSAVGTRLVAPETSGGAAPSARSDVYALGHIVGEVLGLSSGPAQEVVAAATAQEPRGRPVDAWALRDALKQVRDAPAPEPTPPKQAPEPEPVAAPPPAPEPPSPEPEPAPNLVPAPQLPAVAPKSNPLWPILFMLGGGLLLLLGFAGVFAYAFMRPRPPAVTAPSAGTATPPVAVPAPPPLPSPTPSSPHEPAEPAEPNQSDRPDATPPASQATGPGPAAGGKLPGSGAPLPVSSDLPMQGAANTAVTLVFFGDLACPHTRRNVGAVRKLRTAFPSDLRIVFRHRPLPQHSHARSAAHIAAGVHLDHGSDAFFGFLQTLSTDLGNANSREVKEALSRVRIPHLDSWQKDPRVKRRVEDDERWAGLFAVRRTPTFFINGLRMDGFQSYRALETQIKKERAAARSLSAQGVAESRIYLARTRKNMIGIGLDVPERTCPRVSSQPARGASKPLVTIVEFSDFQCRYCKRVAPALDQVLAKRGGDVRLVWRNFPLSNHSRARAAATLAIEAHSELGGTAFWQAHDQLFDTQSDLSDPALMKIARALGLDPKATLNAVHTDAHASTLRADITEGLRVGVRGTPALYINGRSVAGARKAKELLRIVDEEIEWARRLTRGGTPRHRIYSTVCGS